LSRNIPAGKLEDFKANVLIKWSYDEKVENLENFDSTDSVMCAIANYGTLLGLREAFEFTNGK
jgi:hypothetical protein